MKINAQGQLEIPSDIGEKTGLLPNTEVELEIHGDKLFVSKAPGRKSKQPQRSSKPSNGSAPKRGVKTKKTQKAGSFMDALHKAIAKAPKGTWDGIPADSSLNYKHYLYGHAKK